MGESAAASFDRAVLEAADAWLKDRRPRMPRGVGVTKVTRPQGGGPITVVVGWTWGLGGPVDIGAELDGLGRHLSDAFRDSGCFTGIRVAVDEGLLARERAADGARQRADDIDTAAARG
ncbi:MAG: hypothetical protein AAFX79_10795 [Planctomycetota bacterium]